MTNNPLLNALAAEVYIVLVGSVMFYGTKSAPGPDALIAPIAVMSLFTLSAAVMGYLFCYTPLMMYFDGKKKQAVVLFLRTVGIFGVFTTIAMFLLFTGVIR